MSQLKPDESPGEFQQFTQQFMTYTASSQLPPSPDSSSRKIATAVKIQKPKLKIMNQTSQKQKNNNSLDGMLNSNIKNKKYMASNCKIIAVGDAVFRSNFQSGNIQTVNKVAPSVYQITLTREMNSNRVSAWFFFIAEGLKGQIKFIIKGFTKTSSLYNDGMKICYREAHQGKWRRGGTKILYTQSYSQNQQSKPTYQLQFNYFFKSNYPNSVEFAYCFPYTYTNLIKFLSLSQSKLTFQSLGKSYENRQIPLITIGNKESQYVIIVSARAHPGETVGSIMMEGFIKQLMSDSDYSKHLRQVFLFKIVPMINPDGVFNGNYRFSGSGYDLNRKWKSCTSKMHPEVYYFKQKIRQISKEKHVLMFIDLHGHSRQKNVFFYGCPPKNPINTDGNANTKHKQFPFLMSKLHTAFRYDYCSYGIQKDKQGTARISMYNQLKTDYIYTLEASLSGTDIANFLIQDYQKVGAKLCQGICLHFWSIIKLKSKNMNQNESKIQSKINDELKKNMSQFYENPQLAKIQYQGNSSDSEPQAGQIPENERQKKKDKDKSVISIQKYYKASRIMKFSDKIFFDEDNSLIKNKECSQIKPELRNKTNESVRFPKKSHELINIDIRSQAKNLSTQITLKTQNQFFVRADLLNKTINERLKIQNQKQTEPIQNFVRVISEPFKNESQGQKNQQDKNKKKAISFEGAQYRRVRKLAEQHNRRHFSAQNAITQKEDQTLIRGLVGMNNLLEIQRTGPKNRTHSFYPNNSYYNSKSRKGTAQLHFRRQIKASDYTSRRLYVNGLEQQVRCFGKQII